MNTMGLIGISAFVAMAGGGRAGTPPPLPVAVVVEHGEFEDKATEDLEKLAKKFRERLGGSKVKLAALVEDPSQAVVVVKLLSKEWQDTGSAITSSVGIDRRKASPETAFGVYGVILAGESTLPFNLRLAPVQVFNKDNTLSAMLDKHVEDFLKRNYEKLSAQKR